MRERQRFDRCGLCWPDHCPFDAYLHGIERYADAVPHILAVEERAGRQTVWMID
jgi:hypothetical protein